MFTQQLDPVITSDNTILEQQPGTFQEYNFFSLSVLRQEQSENASRTQSLKITEQTLLLQKLRQEQCAGFLLLRTLAKTFGTYFLSGTLCLLIHDAFMFSIPQLLRSEIFMSYGYKNNSNMH